jgi:hypothetical protein
VIFLVRRGPRCAGTQNLKPADCWSPVALPDLSRSDGWDGLTPIWSSRTSRRPPAGRCRRKLRRPTRFWLVATEPTARAHRTDAQQRACNAPCASGRDALDSLALSAGLFLGRMTTAAEPTRNSTRVALGSSAESSSNLIYCKDAADESGRSSIHWEGISSLH